MGTKGMGMGQESPAELRTISVVSEDADTIPKSPPRTANWLVLVIVVGAHLAAGPSLILINRHILKELHFDFPMTVASLGQFSSALCSWVWYRFFRPNELEYTDIEPKQRKSIWVVGAANAGTLIFGNAVYMYLTVSFIQMLKAFTPAVTLAMLVLFAVEIPSRRVAMSVLMICLGTAIASFNEINLAPMGLLLMAGAEITESTKLVLAQKMMSDLKFSALEGLYHMAPVCTVWLWGLACFFELPRMIHQGKYVLIQQYSHFFVGAMVLGFGINLITYMVLKLTNAVTLKVIGTARNAGLVWFGVLFHGDIVSAIQLLGYGISLGFFFLYGYYKSNKM